MSENMEKSLSNFEYPPESASKNGSSESENGGSDPAEIINVSEIEQNNTPPTDGNDKSGSAPEEILLDEEILDDKLPETVKVLVHEKTGIKVYLVGTAHFSTKSKEDVAKVIQLTQPSVLLIELCPARSNMLTMSEETVLREAQDMSASKVLETVQHKGFYNGVMYLLLLNMSANITKQLGMAPGGEFREAVNEGRKIPGIEIRLADRPIDITMHRALSKLTWMQSFKLAWHLITSRDPVSAEEIEKCKNVDMLEQLLTEMAGEYPAFRDVFLDERDVYMTYQIQAWTNVAYRRSKGQDDATPEHLARGDQGPPPTVVAVVGIGHVPGIQKLLNTEIEDRTINDLLTVPPPSLTSVIVRGSFKFGLIGFGGYLVVRYVPVPRFVIDGAKSALQKLLVTLREPSVATVRFSMP